MMNGVECYSNNKPHLLFFIHPPLKTIPKTITLVKNNQSQSTHHTNNNNNNNKINTNLVTEIRVCTNNPCRRQSSLQILHTLSNISPPHVSVTSCGCLGSCGTGPNIVLLPGPVRVKHCSTPARAVRTLFNQVVVGDGSDAEVWIRNTLAGLALRKRAEEEMCEGGDLSHSVHLLSEAINLKPCGGIHHLYKARSAGKLMMGNIAEALEDAQEAITQAPNYTEAYICKADALMAIDEYDAAEKSYEMAAELDPSLFRSKPFKARIAKLQKKLIAADSQ